MAAVDNFFFYEDEVFRVNSKGLMQFGTVIENSELVSSNDETSDDEYEGDYKMKKGHIRVAWHPSGLTEVISETKVGLADRSLMPGDVVKRLVKDKNTQRGYCSDIKVSATVQIVGTKLVIENLPTSQLAPLAEFSKDLAVYLDHWVGVIRDVHMKLLVSCTDGSKAYISDPSLLKTLMNQRKSKCLHEDFPRKSDFYPGQRLIAPRYVLSSAQWMYKSSEYEKLAARHKHLKLIVERMDVDFVDVTWRCTAFTGNTSQPCLTPRDSIVKGPDLDRLRVLNHFEACTMQVGDRVMFTPTPQNEILTMDVWRERKRDQMLASGAPLPVHHRRKHSRRKTKKLASWSDAPSKEPAQMDLDSTLKDPNLEVQVTVNSVSETTIVQGVDNPVNDTGIVNQDNTESKEDTKLVKDNDVPSIYFEFASEGDSEDWDTDNSQNGSDFENSTSCCTTETSSVASSTRLNSESSRLNSESSNLDPLQNQEESLTSSLPALSPPVKRRSVALATRLMRRRNKAKQRARGKKSQAMAAFKDGMDVASVLSRQCVVEILCTQSAADVVWQDGSIEQDISSMDLYPIHYLDEKEFFPGDFVVEERVQMGEYGVVRQMDHVGRTAKIQWFVISHTDGEGPQYKGEQEMSVYDIKDHPDFQFRPGSVVMNMGGVPAETGKIIIQGRFSDRCLDSLSKALEGTKAKRDPKPFSQDEEKVYVGQVLDNFPEGRIKVYWVDGSISSVWPQDLYKIGDYNSDEGELWATSSEDSWETDDSLFDGDEETDYFSDAVEETSALDQHSMDASTYVDTILSQLSKVTRDPSAIAEAKAILTCSVFAAGVANATSCADATEIADATSNCDSANTADATSCLDATLTDATLTANATSCADATNCSDVRSTLGSTNMAEAKTLGLNNIAEATSIPDLASKLINAANRADLTSTLNNIADAICDVKRSTIIAEGSNTPNLASSGVNLSTNIADASTPGSNNIADASTPGSNNIAEATSAPDLATSGVVAEGTTTPDSATRGVERSTNIAEGTAAADLANRGALIGGSSAADSTGDVERTEASLFWAMLKITHLLDVLMHDGPGTRDCHGVPSTRDWHGVFREDLWATFKNLRCLDKLLGTNLFGDCQTHVESILSIMQAFESAEFRTSTPSTSSARSHSTTLTREISNESEPSTTLTRNISNESEPSTTLTRNISNESEPSTTLTRKISNESEPSTTLTRNISNESEPSTTLTREISNESEPSTTLTRNISNESEPRTTLTRNISNESEPKSANENTLSNKDACLREYCEKWAKDQAIEDSRINSEDRKETTASSLSPQKEFLPSVLDKSLLAIKKTSAGASEETLTALNEALAAATSKSPLRAVLKESLARAGQKSSVHKEELLDIAVKGAFVVIATREELLEVARKKAVVATAGVMKASQKVFDEIDEQDELSFLATRLETNLRLILSFAEKSSRDAAAIGKLAKELSDAIPSYETALGENSTGEVSPATACEEAVRQVREFRFVLTKLGELAGKSNPTDDGSRVESQSEVGLPTRNSSSSCSRNEIPKSLESSIPKSLESSEQKSISPPKTSSKSNETNGCESGSDTVNFGNASRVQNCEDCQISDPSLNLSTEDTVLTVLNEINETLQGECKALYLKLGARCCALLRSRLLLAHDQLILKYFPEHKQLRLLGTAEPQSGDNLPLHLNKKFQSNMKYMQHKLFPPSALTDIKPSKAAKDPSGENNPPGLSSGENVPCEKKLVTAPGGENESVQPEKARDSADKSRVESVKPSVNNVKPTANVNVEETTAKSKVSSVKAGSDVKLAVNVEETTAKSKVSSVKAGSDVKLAVNVEETTAKSKVSSVKAGSDVKLAVNVEETTAKSKVSSVKAGSDVKPAAVNVEETTAKSKVSSVKAGSDVKPAAVNVEETTARSKVSSVKAGSDVKLAVSVEETTARSKLSSVKAGSDVKPAAVDVEENMAKSKGGKAGVENAEENLARSKSAKSAKEKKAERKEHKREVAKAVSECFEEEEDEKDAPAVITQDASSGGERDPADPVATAVRISSSPESGTESFVMLDSLGSYAHRYAKRSFSVEGTQGKVFYKTLRKEMALLRSSLPPGIWVRGFEDRLDLLSVMIEGPRHTPYEDGLFYFDFQLPLDYPSTPPLCHYISYCSDRLNPNLYETGKVCVSLLGTWSGRGTEVWTANSTLLQLLISIQGLILNAEPYYNEAGYERQRLSQHGQENARMYNELVLLKLIGAMDACAQRPPAVWAVETRAHFRQRARGFAARLEHWLRVSGEMTGTKRAMMEEAEKGRGKKSAMEAEKGRDKKSAMEAEKGRDKKSAMEAEKGRDKKSAMEAEKGRDKKSAMEAEKGRDKKSAMEAEKGRDKKSAMEAEKGRDKKSAMEAEKGRDKKSAMEAEKGRDKKSAMETEKGRDKKSAMEAEKGGEKKSAMEAEKGRDKKSAMEAEKGRDKKSAMEAEKGGEKKSAMEAEKGRDKKSAMEAEKGRDKKSAMEAEKGCEKKSAMEAEKGRDKKSAMEEAEKGGEKKSVMEAEKGGEKKSAMEAEKGRDKKSAMEEAEKGRDKKSAMEAEKGRDKKSAMEEAEKGGEKKSAMEAEKGRDKKAGGEKERGTTDGRSEKVSVERKRGKHEMKGEEGLKEGGGKRCRTEGTGSGVSGASETGMSGSRDVGKSTVGRVNGENVGVKSEACGVEDNEESSERYGGKNKDAEIKGRGEILGETEEIGKCQSNKGVCKGNTVNTALCDRTIICDKPVGNKNLDNQGKSIKLNESESSRVNLVETNAQHINMSTNASNSDVNSISSIGSNSSVDSSNASNTVANAISNSPSHPAASDQSDSVVNSSETIYNVATKTAELELPQFPLLPASRGFCLTLKSLISSFRKTMQTLDSQGESSESADGVEVKTEQVTKPEALVLADAKSVTSSEVGDCVETVNNAKSNVQLKVNSELSCNKTSDLNTPCHHINLGDNTTNLSISCDENSSNVNPLNDNNSDVNASSDPSVLNAPSNETSDNAPCTEARCCPDQSLASKLSTNEKPVHPILDQVGSDIFNSLDATNITNKHMSLDHANNNKI